MRFIKSSPTRLMPMMVMLFFMGVWLGSCEKEKTAAKSMKQIFDEKGVPVRIQAVKPREFSTYFSYHASLSGIEESSAYAAFGERVEAIDAKVGDEVKKGQVIVTFPDDNSEARYNQAKVGYENARIGFERMSRLRSSGGISEQEYDNVKAQYKVAEANWDAVRKMIKVTAPIDGRISKINVSKSQNVRRGAELFTVSRTDRVKAQIWISEKEILEVTEGMPAQAYWNGRQLKGEVVRVDRAINANHQAFGAQVDFDNPDERVRSGVTAEIRILTYTNPQALVVEKRLLMSERQQKYLFLSYAGQARKVPVTAGRRQGLDVEILNGLRPDDAIVTAGHQQLVDGTKTNIIQ
ncbi:MAG: efflux RND transporter periplasmic adaptor subunit [Proteobacteria bacterium]|nr:efflux RND transporter periplasmic adaptor subunit [Pseudomonadota bacterium]